MHRDLFGLPRIHENMWKRNAEQALRCVQQTPKVTLVCTDSIAPSLWVNALRTATASGAGRMCPWAVFQKSQVVQGPLALWPDECQCAKLF